ncbi:MAG: protease pro-enzyme activation domain-containing protein [Thermoplasmata archaeon]
MSALNRSGTRHALTIAVAVVMVLSTAFVAASIASAPTATVSTVSAPPLAPVAPAPSGPLTQVAPASNLHASSTTDIGDTAVAPVPSAYKSTAPLTVTVNLVPSHSLTNYDNEISNPNSPEYRSFLTASAIGEGFGANPSTYAEESNYFSGYGLTVTPSATLLELTVSGTVANIAAAFHTQLGAFQETYTSQGVWNSRFGDESAVPGSVTTGPVFYSNIAPAALPASIQQSISGIAGLDGLYATPNAELPAGLSPATTATSAGVSPDHFSASLNASDIQSISGANFTWANLTPTFYCLDEGLCGDYQFLWPSTMHVLEGASGLWSGSSAVGGLPDKGQGITVALVEVGCIFPSDISSFSQQVWGNPNQLPDRVTQFALAGPTAFYPNDNLANCLLNSEAWGWTFEASLDLEYLATMAPAAHIDVIGVPSADFSAFDSAYLSMAQYLTAGTTCSLTGSGITVVAGTAGRACSVSIDSNSWGSGEQDQYFFGAPMYISVEDQDLAILNAEGVTNLFSSGDGGSFGVAASAAIPAVSPGATSVGGGSLTAYGKNGEEFPSGKSFCFGVITNPMTNACSEFNMTVAKAKGVASFTYWSYDGGETGTFQGATGGGFGASVAEPQPWWQNALDSYSTGTQISPVVSNTANFNMTAWFEGAWYIFYGGTSFACPITAGELALVEEQANLVLGTPKLGDVNPALFAAHNAEQAGVPADALNAYVPMTNVGIGSTYAPANYYASYLWNLSINEPSDPLLPSWFATLSNPAGSGWNFLQGLGMPQATILSNELVGTVSGQRGLLDPSSLVLEQTGKTAAPFTTLTGGVSVTFDIVPTGGSSGPYTIQAYSGGANDGSYGGGTVTTITGSSGTFTYTPTYTVAPFPTGTTEYGYFVVIGASGSSPVSFAAFAVAPPAPTGKLTLCVTDAYGVCEKGSANVPMFTTVQTGFYNLYGSSTVELGGVPVANALVYQTVFVTQFALSDPTMPPSSYAPGTVIGHTLTDARGNGLFWTAPEGLAEVNGTLLTQVYELQAYYNGVWSNPVLVFVEPQSGSYFTDVHESAGVVTGTVQFQDMKYANWINISVGGGGSENVSFAPGTTDNGQFSISLAAPSGGPIVLGLTTEGANNVGYSECFDGFCFSETAIQSPMYWQEALLVPRGS